MIPLTYEPDSYSLIAASVRNRGLPFAYVDVSILQRVAGRRDGRGDGDNAVRGTDAGTYSSFDRIDL